MPGVMWSRKQCVCSAVNGASKCDDQDGPCAGLHIYPFAIALRVRVLQQRQYTLAEVGSGGWVSAHSRSTISWGAPWRTLGLLPCAAIPLTIFWTFAIAAHMTMLVFCLRSLMNIGCGSRTCLGVAAAQLSISISTLAAALFMLQMDLRYDPAVSPPRPSDANTCTGVSMVALTSVVINSGEEGGQQPDAPI